MLEATTSDSASAPAAMAKRRLKDRASMRGGLLDVRSEQREVSSFCCVR
jgi:hypothetical protein